MGTQLSLLLHRQFPFKYEKALGRNPLHLESPPVSPTPVL